MDAPQQRALTALVVPSSRPHLVTTTPHQHPAAGTSWMPVRLLGNERARLSRASGFLGELRVGLQSPLHIPVESFGAMCDELLVQSGPHHIY